MTALSFVWVYPYSQNSRCDNRDKYYSLKQLTLTSSNKFQKLSYDAILSTHCVLCNCFNFLFFESLLSITCASTLFLWGEFSKYFTIYNK